MVLSFVFVWLYTLFTIEIYRQSNSLGKSLIALILHPILTEITGTILKISIGSGKSIHPFYDHLHTFTFETILNLYRRFLFVNTGDLGVQIILIIASGVEEVITRSTVQWREEVFRKLLHKPISSEEELIEKRKFWSYTVTSNAIVEITSILVSGVMFISFSNNRFAIDLGYVDYQPVLISAVATSVIFQILIEVIVDFICMIIERSKNYPESDFFFQFRNKEIFLIHFFGFATSIHWILHSMKTIPSFLLCDNSNDPCTCPSFNVYDFYCKNIRLNSTMKSDNSSSILNSSNNEYGSNNNFLLNEKEGYIFIGVIGLLSSIALIILIFNNMKGKKLVKQAATHLVHSEVKKGNLLLDVTTSKLQISSSIEKVIGILESLSRGTSPAQSKMILEIVNLLKSNEIMSVDHVDVKRILNTNNYDTEVVEWLENQLMINNNHTDVMKRVSIVSPSSGSIEKKSIHSFSSLNDFDDGRGDVINLDEISCWSFSVFIIKSATPQYFLALKCFENTNIFNELKLLPAKLKKLLLFVDKKYSMVNYNESSAYNNSFNSLQENPLNRSSSSQNGKPGNSYHNNLHGADVFQSVFYFIKSCQDITSDFSTLDNFALLFAAYVHDFNHPGLNTTYVVNDWPASGISTTFGSEVSR